MATIACTAARPSSRLAPFCGYAVENGRREPFDLKLVCKRILAQDPVELAVAGRETLDVARLVKPGQMHPTGHASFFTLNLKSFLKVAAHRYLQIEMPE